MKVMIYTKPDHWYCGHDRNLPRDLAYAYLSAKYSEFTVKVESGDDCLMFVEYHKQTEDDYYEFALLPKSKLNDIYDLLLERKRLNELWRNTTVHDPVLNREFGDICDLVESKWREGMYDFNEIERHDPVLIEQAIQYLDSDSNYDDMIKVADITDNINYEIITLDDGSEMVINTDQAWS